MVHHINLKKIRKRYWIFIGISVIICILCIIFIVGWNAPLIQAGRNTATEEKISRVTLDAIITMNKPPLSKLLPNTREEEAEDLHIVQQALSPYFTSGGLSEEVFFYKMFFDDDLDVVADRQVTPVIQRQFSNVKVVFYGFINKDCEEILVTGNLNNSRTLYYEDIIIIYQHNKWSIDSMNFPMKIDGEFQQIKNGTIVLY